MSNRDNRLLCIGFNHLSENQMFVLDAFVKKYRGTPLDLNQISLEGVLGFSEPTSALNAYKVSRALLFPSSVNLHNFVGALNEMQIKRDYSRCHEPVERSPMGRKIEHALHCGG